MPKTPWLTASLVVAACSGAPKARPNLPPPEYEEPGGVETAVVPLVADAGAAPSVPATTP